MSELALEPKRILVTGAAGAIAQPVCARLRARGHFVRGLDRNEPTADVDEAWTGDLVDGPHIAAACHDIDVVIHLAAYRNDADFMEVLLTPNVIGLHNICQGAVQSDVSRLVLASTIQTINGHGRDRSERAGPIRIADGPLPTNHYALTKVWAEQMGDMMARCHGVSVVAVRIGWFARDPQIARRIDASPHGADTYFSPGDAAHFFTRCVESSTPAAGECAVVFATSRPRQWMRVDLTPALELLGYDPQDTWPEGLPFAF